MATITIEAPDSCADALARIDGLCLGEYGVEDVIRSALWELSDDVEEIAGASEFSPTRLREFVQKISVIADAADAAVS